LCCVQNYHTCSLHQLEGWHFIHAANSSSACSYSHSMYERSTLGQIERPSGNDFRVPDGQTTMIEGVIDSFLLTPQSVRPSLDSLLVLDRAKFSSFILAYNRHLTTSGAAEPWLTQHKVIGETIFVLGLHRAITALLVHVRCAATQSDILIIKPSRHVTCYFSTSSGCKPRRVLRIYTHTSRSFYT
jgi:hypothetical protein